MLYDDLLLDNLKMKLENQEPGVLSVTTVEVSPDLHRFIRLCFISHRALKNKQTNNDNRNDVSLKDYLFLLLCGELVTFI